MKNIEELLNVLEQSITWLPTSQLRKQAAELFLEVGIENKVLSEGEILKTRLFIAKNSL